MRPAELENWMRAYYYTATADIGSSGVAPWRLGELCAHIGLAPESLQEVTLRDATSEGHPWLRAGIAARWGAGDPDRVLVTHGSSEAIFLIVAGLLRAGDEVVTTSPCYHALDAVAEWVGCRVRRWPLRAEDGFRPDLDRLAGLVTPDTRMILVNFPHNPTGAVLDRPGADRLREIAEAAGAYLVWDAAFADLVYAGVRHPDPTAGYSRGIAVGTLSKAYGLPGLRIGWAHAGPGLLAALQPLRDRTTIAVSPLAEVIAGAVVAAADAVLAPRLAQARHNRDLLAAWAAGLGDRVELPPADGGVTAFPRLRTEHPGGVRGLCHELGAEDRVMLVPGDCFGTADRVRLGFGGSTAELSAGLAALGRRLS